MATRKGVWNLQQVRDKQLQSLWDRTGSLFIFGKQEDYGQLMTNSRTNYSSPIQVPGTFTSLYNTWSGTTHVALAKGVGTFWTCGRCTDGQLGQNDEGTPAHRSSPVQVPGTTWAVGSTGQACTLGTKTDGTLWIWGNNERGKLGLNEPNASYKSSPTQIPGTTWGTTPGTLNSGQNGSYAIKTDGTLWSWGDNEKGELAQNHTAQRSSPVQIGSGTDWAVLSRGGNENAGAIKTDGTLWTWGDNDKGELGLNDNAKRSSPAQIPGTNWAQISMYYRLAVATKTDGTLWSWGYNSQGQLGQNNTTSYSSPVQIPGTTWPTTYGALGAQYHVTAVKTDGTLWGWGTGGYGTLGQNNTVQYSSPIQIGSGTDWWQTTLSDASSMAI